jgi:glucose-6-phosphate 1-dehydrogenase
VTKAEAFCVEGRGRFYEEVGAIRDVVQNHLLQVVALLTMDAPIGHHLDALRDQKHRAFRAMRPLAAADVVRGQFRGYRAEEGVAPDSNVETFAAMRLCIDSGRWAGVPFYNTASDGRYRIEKDVPGARRATRPPATRCWECMWRISTRVTCIRATE